MDPSVLGTGQIVLSRASAARLVTSRSRFRCPRLRHRRVHSPGRKQLRHPGRQHRSPVSVHDPELGSPVRQPGRPAAGLHLQDRLLQLHRVWLELVCTLPPLCRAQREDQPPPGHGQHSGQFLQLHQPRHNVFHECSWAKYADWQRHHRLVRDPARRHKLQLRQHGAAAHDQEPGRRPLDPHLGRRARSGADDPGTLAAARRLSTMRRASSNASWTPEAESRR